MTRLREISWRTR